MDVKEIQTQPSHHQPLDDFSGDDPRRPSPSSRSTILINRLPRSWQHYSSRIIRVSKASGGKDRHSKVLTAKGPRDRRVRLSVSTAVQFYHLQDRLGFDQPSKAVEWLIKAASDSIADLPSLNMDSDEKNTPRFLGFDSSAELEIDHGVAVHTQRSSACSSISESSERDRYAKEEDSSSFTQLLTSTMNTSPSPMDYSNASESSFSGQVIELGNSGMIQHLHYVPGNYLNFSNSPSPSSAAVAGLKNDRGTLQSNSSLLSPTHLQRFSSSVLMDGPAFPFFLGTPVDNQPQDNGTTQFQQLCYGQNGHLKGKPKN